MSGISPRLLRWLLPGLLLVGAPVQSGRADPAEDAKQIALALDQYGAAKTAAQRGTVVDYLRQFDRKLVADSLVDHILAADNGVEATTYGGLIEPLAPEACSALLDRLAKAGDPIAKAKLIVALRHCSGNDALHSLTDSLSDARAVLFEARGDHPRRVCDFAYDELYLKLRANRAYGLDPSPRMKGLISEGTPIKTRDALIKRLQSKLRAHTPLPSASPSSPATADIAAAIS